MEQNLKFSNIEGGGGGGGGGGGSLVNSTSYRQVIGSLIYLKNTHPNLSYAVNNLSRFMQEPIECH
jgi:hypothetical protein